MQVSTKGRYVLRAVVDIALHQSEGPVKIVDISKRENISKSYLENMIMVLKQDGLLISTRGNRGGYRLARELSQITVADVVLPLEGKGCTAPCQKDGFCDKKENCLTKKVWEKAQQAFLDALRAVTIEEIVDQCSSVRK